jgi:hypothetical protein
MNAESIRARGLLICAAAACLAVGCATVNAAEEGEPAVWKAKQFNFTYMGFTTKYSCEGLASRVKSVLLTLGARKEDLHVIGTGCAVQSGRPTFAPGVNVKLSVLEPASAANGAAAGSTETVAAHWKTVELKLDNDPVSESGECEFLEQLKQKVLPLFATRDVEFNPACVPHQLSPSGASLRAQVLTR